MTQLSRFYEFTQFSRVLIRFCRSHDRLQSIIHHFINYFRDIRVIPRKFESARVSGNYTFRDKKQ